MEEEEGVEAKLEGVSERLRDGCGRGSGVGGDELRSVAGGRGSRGEDGDERVSDGFQEGCVASLEARGRSRRWPGKQEVAEAASAPVGHARCLLARGRRQGGRLVGWAAPVGCQHRSWAGCWRQVSALCSVLLFCFLLLISFAIVLNLNKFKQCQKLL